MSEPFQVKLPMRIGYHEFKLMREAFGLHGIDTEEALEIERETIGSAGLTMPIFIIHGPKRQEKP